LLLSYKVSRAIIASARKDLIEALQTDDENLQEELYEKWLTQSENAHVKLLDLITYKKELLEKVIDQSHVTNEKIRRLLIGLLALSFAFMFIASTYHNMLIIRPIKQLKAHVERISRGDLQAPSDWKLSHDELDGLGLSFLDMTKKLKVSQEALKERVHERTRELMAANERIEQEVSNVRKFQQAVESAFDAVFMASKDSRIVYVNPAWERLTGYSREELMGQDAWIFTDMQTDSHFRTQFHNAIRRGESFYTEDIPAHRKNGADFEMELTVYPLKDADGSTFLVGVAHDITRRRRLDRAKTDFVSLASHQLRTPLTGIRWALGRLHKGKDVFTEHQQQMLAAARSATSRMAETIDTMLSISRVEAERIELKPWDLRLDIFLSNLIHECAHLYEQKRQKVTLDCDKDLRARTDPNVLHEIVSNLLTNAIKYTPEHGKIHLQASQHGKHIWIEIQDTGFGIPPNQQHKVFSKFFRGDNIVQNDPDGTGLGLYLVYALVRLIGGSITFVSEENRGTTFTLLLPITLPTYGQNGAGR